MSEKKRGKAYVYVRTENKVYEKKRTKGKIQKKLLERGKSIEVKQSTVVKNKHMIGRTQTARDGKEVGVQRTDGKGENVERTGKIVGQEMIQTFEKTASMRIERLKGSQNGSVPERLRAMTIAIADKCKEFCSV